MCAAHKPPGACGNACFYLKMTMIRTSSHRRRARHLALECPRAALLLDALARAYAGAVGWRVAPGRSYDSLLREVGAAMVTGYQGGAGRGAEPLRALAAECSAALTGRWSRESWAGSLAFGVERRACTPARPSGGAARRSGTHSCSLE